MLKTPQKFEIGTLPNMTSSRPRDRVTWGHHDVRNILIHCKSFYIYRGTRNQWNTNEIVSESNNNAQILLSVHKKFEKKSMPKAFHKMALTQQVGMIFYWNFQWTHKTKFCSVKKMGRPSTCPDFLLFQKKLWGVVFTLPPFRIGLTRIYIRLTH